MIKAKINGKIFLNVVLFYATIMFKIQVNSMLNTDCFYVLRIKPETKLENLKTILQKG